MNELKRSLETSKQIQEMKSKENENTNEFEKDCGDTENANLFKKIKICLCNLTKKQKITLLTSLFLSFIIGMFIAVFVFKVDTVFFPSSIEGYILDAEKKPVEGAEVCVGNSCYTTERNGYFLVSNLKYGNVEFSVTAENFKSYSEMFYIGRGRTEKNIYLNPLGYGSLQGQLVVENKDYDFSNISIQLDTHDIKLLGDGNFAAEEVAIGDYELTIASVDFVDVEKEIKIEGGVNNLGQIKLEKGADVSVTVINWLSGKELGGVTVSANNTKKETSDKGNVTFKDISLKDSDEIELTAKKSGYNIKMKKVKITQGTNELEKVSIVKTGKVAYVSNRLGNKNVYISNYDGSGEIMLSDNKGDSYSPYLTEDKKTVKFLSTREFVKGENGYVVALAYSVSAQGGPISRVSKTNYQEEDIGHIGSYDFSNMKRAFVNNKYDSETETTKSSIYFGDLDGTNLRKLIDIEGYVYSIKMSNSGTFVVYNVINKKDTSKSGLYTLEVSSSNPRKLKIQDSDVSPPYIQDIAPDDSKILVNKYNKDKTSHDLWIVGISSAFTNQITSTSTSEQHARFTPNGDQVSFLTRRDGKKDVYLIGVDGTNEIQVTSDGKVNDYFTTDEGYVFYNSEKTMWITEANSSNKSEKVTENVLGSYYSMNYECYGGGLCE